MFPYYSNYGWTYSDNSVYPCISKFFENHKKTNLMDYSNSINIRKNEEENDNMKTIFMKGMFGPIQAGMCRLTMDGTIAIKTESGYKAYKDGAFINCDEFVFDIGDEMFFVIPTNDVKAGDIILAGGKPCYVTEVEANKLTVINYQTGNIEQKLPERHVFMGNTYFYGKIVSMFGNVAVGGGENIFKYMMLSQMMKTDGTGTGKMNPMAMIMLMNSGGMGNIFDGLFKTPTSTPTVANADNVKEDK